MKKKNKEAKVTLEMTRTKEGVEFQMSAMGNGDGIGEIIGSMVDQEYITDKTAMLVAEQMVAQDIGKAINKAMQNAWDDRGGNKH